MASFPEYKRRTILPLLVLALGAYYLLIFQQLARKADRLDAPLQEAWKKLAGSLDQTNATSIDFLHITNQLAETRQALSILENTRQKAVTRLEIAATIQARMAAPFELVEYETERSRQLAAFSRNAASLKIAVAPGVYAGFPQHMFEVRDPAMLWPALAFSDGFLATLIRFKVTAIHSLSVPLALTNFPPAEPGRWLEVPVEVEFSAPAAAVHDVLRSLPLRAEELAAAGFPPGAPDQSPLLIDRVVLRKESADQLDQVRAWVRVLGFVRRGGS